MAATWRLHGGIIHSTVKMARPPKNQPIDLAQRANLTAGLIERLSCPDGKTQAFLRDSAVPALRVRVTRKGVKSFVFEAKLNRQTVRRTIGSVQAWTIEQARVEARRLRVQVDGHEDPREVERNAMEAREQAKQARERAAQFTLSALLLDYCDQLQRMGRESHVKARGIFTLHVMAAAPALAKKPACEVTAEEITDLMRKLTESGKDRTAGKLRSYTRAAFEMARTVGTDSRLPVHFKNYRVKHNPAAETKSIDRATDKDPLTGEQLRRYWQSIKNENTFQAAVLRFHLLTGGQRIRQLCALEKNNVNANSIALMDGKGRPGKPARRHIIPLIPAAAQALAEIQNFAPVQSPGVMPTNSQAAIFAISTDGGLTHITDNSLSKWGKAAGKDIEQFKTKRVRSGVETALASLKISSDTRGHLLSHGVAGVQAASYDGHDYMDVKRDALERLYSFLEAKDGTVISAKFGKIAA